MALTAETNGCKYIYAQISSSSPSKLSQVSNMRRAPLAFRNSHFDQHMRSMQGAYLNLLGTCKYIKIYSLRTRWMFFVTFPLQLLALFFMLNFVCSTAGVEGCLWSGNHLKRGQWPLPHFVPLKITKIQLKTEPENKRERQCPCHPLSTCHRPPSIEDSIAHFPSEVPRPRQGIQQKLFYVKYVKPKQWKAMIWSWSTLKFTRHFSHKIKTTSGGLSTEMHLDVAKY